MDKPTQGDIDEPTPGVEMDAQLVSVIRAYRFTQRIVHAFLWVVAIIALVSLVISLAVFLTEASSQQHTVTTVVSAECSFYRDIGTVPPPSNVTEFGIKILVDSRNAYVGLGCAAKLPAPTPDLVNRAANYGLVLKG